MSTDLLTQLSAYGEYHRETQHAMRPAEASRMGVRPVVVVRRPNYVLRRAGAVLVAAVLVILFISVPALLRAPVGEGPADSVATTAPVDVPTTSIEVEAPSTIALEGGPDGFTMSHTLDDGSLMALSQMNVWRSTNNGETWEEWYAQDHEIDLLGMAFDGAVLAVRNPNNTTEALGTGSSVNDTPEVHRYDPASGQWSVIPLPRPDMPAPDLVAQEENIEECGRFGLSSWVDGSSITVGDQVVVLGDQRVVADGICDEDFQFLWTSPDGVNWSIVPDLDMSGYLAGIVAMGDLYVGYGSSQPSYVGPPYTVPQLWTSTDLMAWVAAPVNLSGVPQGAMAPPWPRIRVGSGDLTLTYDIEGYLTGLDTVTDLDSLRQFLMAAGWTEKDGAYLDETLESLGVDFPLDDDEVANLRSFFDIREPLGTLTLSSNTGTDWESVYNPN